MSTEQHEQALQQRWTLLGRIPLGGVPSGAQWYRARTAHAQEPVVLFAVDGEQALDVADAGRRAALVEDPHLFPVRDVEVLDVPGGGELAVVEYPMPSAPPLAAVFKQAPLRPETARALIGAVAEGIDAGRRRGVRHRHLDSNRVFADLQTGAVTILGLGVEAAASGTRAADRDQAAFEDTTAMVAMLYKALTGHAPARGEGGSVPLASSVSERAVPEDLDTLCDAVLNDGDHHGPVTSRELLDMLGPVQSIPVTLEAFDAHDARRRAEEERAAAERERARQEAAVPEADEREAVERESAQRDAAAAADQEQAQAAAIAVPAGAAAAAVLEEQDQDAAIDRAPAAAEAPDRSDEAQQLIDDLQLDRPREGSAFPGQMTIEAAEESAPGAAHPPASAEVTEPSVSPADEDIVSEAADLSSGSRSASTFPHRTGGSPEQWGDVVDEPGTAHRRFDPATGGGAVGPDRTASASTAAVPPAVVAGSGAAAGSVAAVTAGAPPTPSSPSVAPPSEGAGSDERSAEASENLAEIPGETETVPRVHVRNGRRPIFDDDSTAPIIVPGRSRPLGDGETETLPAQPSTLLRDVVSVAMDDPNAGGSYATYGRAQPEEYTRQTQWVLLGAVIFVILALVIAVVIITSGLRDREANPSAPQTAAASESASAEPAEGEQPPAETPAETPVVEPAISGARISDLGGAPGGGDYAEDAGVLTDGDPGTVWRSKIYGTPGFGNLKPGIAIVTDLQEPATVGTVTVTGGEASGGTVELRPVDDSGSPTDEVLASGSFNGPGEIALTPEQPLADASAVAVVITELPQDSRGNRAQIAEIAVSAPPADGGEG